MVIIYIRTISLSDISLSKFPKYNRNKGFCCYVLKIAEVDLAAIDCLRLIHCLCVNLSCNLILNTFNSYHIPVLGRQECTLKPSI